MEKKFENWMKKKLGKITVNELNVAYFAREYALREAIAALPKKLKGTGEQTDRDFEYGYNQCRHEADDNITSLI